MEKFVPEYTDCLASFVNLAKVHFGMNSESEH